MSKTVNKKKLVDFFTSIVKNRVLIASLCRREIKSRFVGSFLGVAWTFIQPLVMITVFWFVFSVGFKAKPMGDVPFVVWLTAGMAAWALFSEIVLASSNSVLEYATLIKKTLFPAQILPLVKVASASVTHFIYLVILVVLILLYKLDVSVYYLQVVYYFFALCMLSLGIGWLVASLNVFVRDVAQVCGVVMQVGFWATPVFWDINIMPEKVRHWLLLNPVFYIVQGYRDSFISFKPFWSHPWQTLYFWTFTLTMFALGAWVFARLQKQFVDVL